MSVSRRSFVSGLAAAMGYLGLGPGTDLFAQGRGQAPGGAPSPAKPLDDFDRMARLHMNENCWGPPDAVLKAMNQSFKYAGRYGNPGGDIAAEIAKHHGVKAENILLSPGSGGILSTVGVTFLMGGKTVLGVEPSYGSVYSHATSLKAKAIKLPLGKDYRQDIPAMIKAANQYASELGFVYLCNPNNPTGIIITKNEVQQLLDGIPKGMPVLIDEAYHHFVEDPAYSTSIPFALEGRPVIVARTFSKIAALAAMRLGYAIAPTELLEKMRPYHSSSTSVAARYGGVASMRDPAIWADVKKKVIALRRKAKTELEAYGYPVIPSEANFFMVHLGGRDVQPVIKEFEQKEVQVGRPFPPMTKHMRISIGREDEMERFMKAFKEIFPQKSLTATLE
jgi:histidinol-phosphate aminotransferase